MPPGPTGSSGYYDFRASITQGQTPPGGYTPQFPTPGGYIPLSPVSHATSKCALPLGCSCSFCVLFLRARTRRVLLSLRVLLPLGCSSVVCVPENGLFLVTSGLRVDFPTPKSSARAQRSWCREEVPGEAAWCAGECAKRGGIAHPPGNPSFRTERAQSRQFFHAPPGLRPRVGLEVVRIGKRGVSAVHFPGVAVRVRASSPGAQFVRLKRSRSPTHPTPPPTRKRPKFPHPPHVRTPTLACPLSRAISHMPYLSEGLGGARTARDRVPKKISKISTPLACCASLSNPILLRLFSHPHHAPRCFSALPFAQSQLGMGMRARELGSRVGVPIFLRRRLPSLGAWGGDGPKLVREFSEPTCAFRRRASARAKAQRAVAACGPGAWHKKTGGRASRCWYFCVLLACLSLGVCRSGRLSAPYFTPRPRGRRSGVLRARLVRVGKRGGRARGTDGSASGRAGTSIFGVRVVVRGRQTRGAKNMLTRMITIAHPHSIAGAIWRARAVVTTGPRSSLARSSANFCMIKRAERHGDDKAFAQIFTQTLARLSAMARRCAASGDPALKSVPFGTSHLSRAPRLSLPRSRSPRALLARKQRFLVSCVTEIICRSLLATTTETGAPPFHRWCGGRPEVVRK